MQFGSLRDVLPVFLYHSLGTGLFLAPCAAPAAEGHLKVQRVCQRTRVSDREGAMRGSGTEQEAVRGMGTGVGRK